MLPRKRAWLAQDAQRYVAQQLDQRQDQTALQGMHSLLAILGHRPAVQGYYVRLPRPWSHLHLPPSLHEFFPLQPGLQAQEGLGDVGGCWDRKVLELPDLLHIREGREGRYGQHAHAMQHAPEPGTCNLNT